MIDILLAQILASMTKYMILNLNRSFSFSRKNLKKEKVARITSQDQDKENVNLFRMSQQSGLNNFSRN